MSDEVAVEKDKYVPSDAQMLVSALLDAGLTHAEISEGIGGHISTRTVYRWAKGQSEPQNTANFQALVDLALARGVA